MKPHYYLVGGPLGFKRDRRECEFMSINDYTTIGTSPSQTALSESALNQKALCDYVVNVADGCRHGCSFCYVQSMPSTWGDPGGKYAAAGIDDPSDEWGSYALYREDLPQNLADDCQRLMGSDDDGAPRWRTTRRGRGIVGLSFATDCYMDRRTAAITGWALRVLGGHRRHMRVLTRNPKLAAALHGDLLAGLGRAGLLTVGTSISTVIEGEAGAIEPDAPAIRHRLAGLRKLERKGVPVFVSLSPTYPTHDKDALRATLCEINLYVSPTVVFHEPINPRSGNIDACVEQACETDQFALARALTRIRDTPRWVKYALQQLRWVQGLGDELDLPIHLWPDKRLVSEAPTAAEREWCEAWRSRPSPEGFGASGGVSDPEAVPMLPPGYDQRRLGDFSTGELDGNP